MPTYAVHDGHTVLNVIVADTKEIAETVTGLSAIETTGEPWINWTFNESVWLPPIVDEPVDLGVEDSVASEDGADANSNDAVSDFDS